MEDSVTYMAIFNKGVAMGHALAEEQGRVKMARRLLLKLGTQLLGNPSEEVVDKLIAIEDLKTLEDLLLKTINVSSWKELLP